MSLVNKVTTLGRRTMRIMKDLRAIHYIDIAECGVDEDDHPFIVLKNGLTFYSYYPSKAEQRLYARFRKKLPAYVPEECFRVACDIVQRYVRENSVHPAPPKSMNLFPGWGFIDLGAYIGYGTIKASQRVGSEGKVLAVEASPDSVPLLKKNIERNNIQNVHVVHAAIQDKDEPIQLFVQNRQNTSIFKKLHDNLDSATLSYEDAVEVPGRTVDSLLVEAGMPFETMPCFTSFEINGAEAKAIQGMDQFLTRSPRFDLRIAARYGERGSGLKDEIHQLLLAYDGVNIQDMGVYQYAHRYTAS